jgi:hypothetical protein
VICYDTQLADFFQCIVCDAICRRVERKYLILWLPFTLYSSFLPSLLLLSFPSPLSFFISFSFFSRPLLFLLLLLPPLLFLLPPLLIHSHTLSLFILSPTLFILSPTFSLFTSPSPSSDIREADEEVEGSEEGWIYALSFADIDAVRAVRDTQGVAWCGVVWCGVVCCIV